MFYCLYFLTGLLFHSAHLATLVRFCNAVLTVMAQVGPQVIGLTEIATVEHLIAYNNAIRLQRGAPAHQHREGVYGTQL